MAIKLDVLTRNARLNAIESTNGSSCSLRIYSGSPPADCASANSGTLLVHILLPADWMNDAATGAKTIKGSWVDASADGSGTAGHFRVYNSQATMDGTTCFMQGTVTDGVSGGDMTLDNVVIAATQQVTITSFTLTDGNA